MRWICTLFLVYSFMGTLAQPRLSQAPRPDWVIEPEQQAQKVNHRSVTQGYYIDLYNHQIHVEKKARYFRIVREIISEAGIQSASEIWMQFNPAYEKTVIHTVTVWRNGEPINKLKIDDFKLIANESQSQNFIYNGSYSAYLILEDIRVGDRIEYAYTITGANPVFEGRFFSDLYLQNDAVIGQLYASILVDPQRHLNMRCMNQAKLPDKQSVKNLDRYQWHDTHVPAVEYEAYQPSWYNAYRYVQITEYKTWEEVAAWAARVNPLKETLGAELSELTAQWRKQSAGDKAVFISKAVRLVQDEIRYTGISIGEYSHRAGDPDKVYRQRFGDCKDKSLLLASVLQKEGIEASVVLVSTWLGSKVEDQLPSPLAFDHAVVYFEYEGRPYWIDPTISYQGGSLREIRFPVSGKGLVLHGPKAGFRPGGYDVRGNVDCEEEYELIAADSTTALLSVKTIYTGWKADEMRSSLAYSSLAETEKNYLDYYTRLYPEAELADSLVVEDDRDENRLVVLESYRIPEFLKPDSSTGRWEVGFYAGMIGNQLPEVTGRRKSPVALSYPSDMDYTIRVISKTGLNIRRESYFADEHSFLFGSSASVRGDTLLLNYQFRFHGHEVAPENVAEFAAHMKQIKNDRLSYGLSFHPGGIGSLNNYSWWAFVYSVLLIALFSFLAVRFYHKKPRWHPADTEQPLKVYNGIGGWLILLMISFALSPFAYLFGLMASNFYHTATWQAYDQQGVGQAILFRGIIFLELSANLFMLVLASFCFLLLVQQKRLFPQVAILYFVSNMIVVIINFSLLPTVDINPFDDPENVRGLFGAIIGAAIWIPYMMHSKRVRGTFVRP